MRRRSLVCACVAAAAMTGCGGTDPPRAQKPATPVALKVSSPTDLTTVRDETVAVKGTVEPAGSAVMVVGQKAAVSGGGTFQANADPGPAGRAGGARGGGGGGGTA